MAVTLKNIAERTGLSIATVHQVINNYDVPFSEKTRRKVLDAAKELDYRPNLMARSLRKQKGFLLGLLFYSVNYEHMSDFCRGLQQAARGGGYVPAVLTHADVAEEADNLRRLLDLGLDGLVVNAALGPGGESNAPRFAELHAGGLPLVEVYGRFIAGAPSVALDYRAGGLAAAQYLIEQGHKRIVLYTIESYREHERTPGRCWTAWEHWQGYRAAMQRAGLPEVVISFPSSPRTLLWRAQFDGAYHAAESIFSAAASGARNLAPTAAVCYTPEAAAGVVQYGCQSASRAPERFSLASFGSDAPLLTGRMEVKIFPAPSERVGGMAAQLLIDKINNQPSESVLLGPDGEITSRPPIALCPPPASAAKAARAK